MKKIIYLLFCLLFIGCASQYRDIENTGGANINGVYRVAGFPYDTTGAGAGTDGTISSRSAGALGECDGFVIIVLSDGTTVYTPYWEDIAP